MSGGICSNSCIKYFPPCIDNNAENSIAAFAHIHVVILTSSLPYHYLWVYQVLTMEMYSASSSLLSVIVLVDANVHEVLLDSLVFLTVRFFLGPIKSG